MNILITGSVGFIGYHLVKELSKTKNKIFGCDNLSSNSKKTQKQIRTAKRDMQASFATGKIKVYDVQEVLGMCMVVAGTVK